MEVEILNKKDNALLKRTEIEFRLDHPKGNTPKRNEARDVLAAELGAKKETVVIDNLKSTFGRPVTYGYAKVYKSVEEARDVEPEYIQRRNHIFVEKKPAGGEEKQQEAAK